jgi:outer membrane lipoprotein SlyB
VNDGSTLGVQVGAREGSELGEYVGIKLG